MANNGVERISFSDFSRTRTLSAQALDARAQAQPGTHIQRLLGIIGTPDEIAGLETLFEVGGLAAKRLLAQKLADIVAALSTFCAIVVVHDLPAPSTYDGGADINALATYMSAQATGTDLNQSVYPTTAGSVLDTCYN